MVFAGISTAAAPTDRATEDAGTDVAADALSLETRRGKIHFAEMTCDTNPENIPAEMKPNQCHIN